MNLFIITSYFRCELFVDKGESQGHACGRSHQLKWCLIGVTSVEVVDQVRKCRCRKQAWHFVTSVCVLVIRMHSTEVNIVSSTSYCNVFQCFCITLLWWRKDALFMTVSVNCWLFKQSGLSSQECVWKICDHFRMWVKISKADRTGLLTFRFFRKNMIPPWR